MIPERFAPVLREVQPLVDRFADAGERLYLVGGTVRDLLANEQQGDFDVDFTTTARPDRIKSIIDGWADAVWTQGERFGTIGAIKRERTYEITTHRAEAYSADSRKPDVQFSDDIEADLSRRDFTVNAMALELTADSPTLVDPFDGVGDLMQRVLRTPLTPAESFSDDPLRMLRAARFISRFRLQPQPELVQAVRDMADRLSIVSAERVRDELDKLMVCPSPTAGLWFCVDTGLADHFLPELPAMRLEHDPIHRHKDVLTHTLAVVENVRPPDERPDRPPYDFRIVRLAALFHDVGKPRTRGYDPDRGGTTFHHHDSVGARMTRKRMQALRYSTADIEAVVELVALHLRVHTYEMGWTDSAVRRYVRDAGSYLNELNELTRCDCTTRNERKAKALSRRMDELESRIAQVAEQEALDSLRPEIDGVRVMEILGMQPGRDVGRALSFLLELRIEEGVLGEDVATERLIAWWSEQQGRAGSTS